MSESTIGKVSPRDLAEKGDRPSTKLARAALRDASPPVRRSGSPMVCARTCHMWVVELPTTSWIASRLGALYRRLATSPTHALTLRSFHVWPHRSWHVRTLIRWHFDTIGPLSREGARLHHTSPPC